MSIPLRKVEPEPEGPLHLTTPGRREIRMERVFDAPRELVWRAHIEPELLAQWWGRGNKLDIRALRAGARRPLALRRTRPRGRLRVRGPVP